MFRFLRVPERLFALAMWATSFIFAGFLVGLGSKLVGELPGVRKSLDMETFLGSEQQERNRSQLDSIRTAEKDLRDERDRAEQLSIAATRAYETENTAFKSWAEARRATVDPLQDAEVIARARTLDTLRDVRRAAEQRVERLDQEILANTKAGEALSRDRARLEESAEASFQKARFLLELKVFGIRLLITLPLLILAAWMAIRKRASEYWPLFRGFVLFAAFVFFVELVPYLPSYGGYVRNGVGVLASIFAGVFLIRGMRRYLDRRQIVEQQTESERRKALVYDEALKRMGAGVCPGCERRILPAVEAGSGASARISAANPPASFCVHCGLMLYDQCNNCHTRKNAFFPYCPACGVSTGVEVPTSSAHR